MKKSYDETGMTRCLINVDMSNVVNEQFRKCRLLASDINVRDQLYNWTQVTSAHTFLVFYDIFQMIYLIN